MEPWNLDDYARHYAETLAKPANAWGQHVSDLFGQSHHIMSKASKYYPSEDVQRAFAKALRDYEAKETLNLADMVSAWDETEE